jgi:hypothetical protein
MRLSEIKKIKILPDEALICIFRGDVDNLSKTEMQDVRKQLVEHIPNADMGRVVIMCLNDETEVEFTQVKMEREKA